jgi:CHRD domain
MRSRRIRFVLPVVIVLALGLVSFAVASTRGHGNGKGHDNGNVFTASLNGHNETPAVHTKGTGSLTLTINPDNTMSFTLTYSGLNNPALVAHVHFGQPNVAGNVVFYFCGGPKPACPAGTTTPATVTGTVTAADILAPAGQGLAAGDIAGMIEEIRAGFAYANVHTSSSPAGEIRGQLSSHGHDQGDNDDN